VGINDAKFGVQVSIGVIGRIVAYIVAFLGSILLARVLGPDKYGTFYLLLSIVSFLENPVTGWAEGARKRFTEVDFPTNQAVGSVLVAIVVATVGVTVVAWLLAAQIRSLTGLASGWVLLSVLFLGMVAYKTTTEVLRGTKYFGATPWVQSGRDTLRVLGQSALVLAGFGVAGMVGGMVVANLIVFPVAVYAIGFRPRLPDLGVLRSIWAYARYSIPGGFVGTAQQRMDRILLGVLATTAVLGNYEVAMKLTLPAMMVAGLAQDGLMSRISNRRSRGEEVVTDIERNLANASVFGVPLFFGALTVGGPVLVTLYSDQYADAVPFFAGLALFRLLRTQTSILTGVINGFDRPRLNLRISLGVFTINLVAGVGLLFAIGPIGVVIATVLSEVFAYGIRAYLVRLLCPSVTLLPRLLLEQIASGVVMAAVVYGARTVLSLATFPPVAATVVLGAVTYFAVLTTISNTFRATVLAILADAGLWGGHTAR
jgi:O-antigen/teichoic acid export membrane protein